MTKRNSLLWEIQFNKEIKGYIFGSMHISSDVAFSDLHHIRKLINDCDAFATEIPLDIASQREMGKHMGLPVNVKLSDLISEKKYEKYSKILHKSFDLNLSDFEHVLPLFLLNYMTQLSLDVNPKSLENTMDFELWNYAKDHDRILTSVESLEDHIQTLYEIPLSFQVYALNSALKNISKFSTSSKKMLSLYKDQKIHKLYQSSKKSLGEIKQILLYQRNKKIAQNIIEITSKNTLFSVFGAAHLSGIHGVLVILKNHGFKISPIQI